MDVDKFLEEFAKRPVEKTIQKAQVNAVTITAAPA